MLHYLPGCDVRNNHPLAIEKLTNYMLNQGAKIDVCCRVTEKFLNDGDVIVQNCTLCELLVKESHPDNECLSIYEYVLRDSTFPFKDHTGEVITVQDCVRTKDNRHLQDAVRACLRRMNYTIVEMDSAYEKTRYCGMWIFGRPMQNCFDVAPKAMNYLVDHYVEILSEEEKIRRMQEWVKQFGSEQVLVYCNGCEKGMKAGGITPIHLVELLAEGLS